jgi:hypothetical protein
MNFAKSESVLFVNLQVREFAGSGMLALRISDALRICGLQFQSAFRNHQEISCQCPLFVMKCELESICQKLPEQVFLFSLVIELNPFNGLRVDIVFIGRYPRWPSGNLAGVNLVSHHHQIFDGCVAGEKPATIGPIVHIVWIGILDRLDRCHFEYRRCAL